MRVMTTTDKACLEHRVNLLMRVAMDKDYIGTILQATDAETGNTVLEDIVAEVLETSAWDDEGFYNESDIRLAIGRVLSERLVLHTDE